MRGSRVELLQGLAAKHVLRLIKNAQRQGGRSTFHLPIRQAILRNEAYFPVRCNDER
jgi:hypothetical protein